MDKKLIQPGSRRLWRNLQELSLFLGAIPAYAWVHARSARIGATPGLRLAKSLRRVLATTAVAALMGVMVPLFSTTAAAAVSQGYNTNDKTIVVGMAVAIVDSSNTDGTTKGVVEKSSLSHADKTLGIVVNPSTDPVLVGSADQQVFIATTGTVPGYVTDLNGAVKKGDFVGPSPIQGVLMKAANGSKGVIGVATEDYPTAGQKIVNVTTAGGQKTQAGVNLVRINLDVKLSNTSTGDGKTILLRVGESVAKHPVSTTQVIAVIVILVLMIVVEGGIVYGAISSSMISLGRNPMARKSIFLGLGQVAVLVGIVLALGVGSIYLVLRI